MSGGFDLTPLPAPAGDLPCVRRGPQGAPRVLIVQPLFEELNRCRRLLAGIGRGLAEAGVGSIMPDLPGTGDADGEPDWRTWRTAVAALSGRSGANGDAPVFVVSIRGGALLTAPGTPRYLIAPVNGGQSLLRDLLRTRVAGDREAGIVSRMDGLEAALAAGETLDLGGYAVTPALAAALGAASLDSGDARVVTIGDDGFAGPLVWRQGEPDPTDALAAALAADIAAWIASCAR